MVVPTVTRRAEDAASAKRIVDDGEEDSKRARIIIFMDDDARCAMGRNSGSSIGLRIAEKPAKRRIFLVGIAMIVLSSPF
jgi:hypothetical protein